jgi:cyclohexa-1,5-dienecarbonyl-CoA hydratase
MSSEGALIRFDVRDEIAFITLDNPPVNIMTAAMMDQISAALGEVRADSSLKGVAVGAGGKAFCAGADVGEHRPEQVEAMIASFSEMFRAFDRLELPVVMAVDGAALGGGFELVQMADILLATELSVFGQPEIRLGFFAPVGVVELAALVGRAKAMEITTTGRNYSAAEMADCGIVTRVVADAAALDEALGGVLKDLRRASPLVLRLNCRTLKRLRGRPFAEALGEAERVFLKELMVSEEPGEGIAAFYEKRKPVWKNR